MTKIIKDSLHLTLATGNSHKCEEFISLQKIFSPLHDEKNEDSDLRTRLSLGPASRSIEVDETGTTYFENAFLKASAYYNFVKGPVLADDSGVEVLALPGELGIYSARFGGEGLSDKDRCELLLKKMSLVENKEERAATFMCVLCAYLSPEEYYFFEGRVPGYIGLRLEGQSGFGYDPLFFPSKNPKLLSYAQDLEWKEKNSHRAIAFQGLLQFFQ